MATTSPARIDDDLYASAKLAGEVQSRSASQQVVHWARIGREIEASSSISQREVAEVLAGSRSYDSLSPKEQAVVRAEWSIKIDERRAALSLAEEFAAQGRSWVELDESGAVVERGGSDGPRATPVASDQSSSPRTTTNRRASRAGESSASGRGTKRRPSA